MLGKYFMLGRQYNKEALSLSKILECCSTQAALLATQPLHTSQIKFKGLSNGLERLN